MNNIFSSHQIKKLIFLFLISLLSYQSEGQIFESFENITPGCTTSLSSGAPFSSYSTTPTPFFNGCVPNWHSANGKPWVVHMPDTLYPPVNHHAADSNNAAVTYFYNNGLDTGTVTGSIYYTDTFLAGHDYQISYDIWVSSTDTNTFLGDSAYFDIVLANNLVNTTNKIVPNITAAFQVIQNIPSGALQSINNGSSSTGNWVTETATFTPATNYTQVWFRPDAPSFNSDTLAWYDSSSLTKKVDLTAFIDSIIIIERPTIKAINTTICSGGSTNVVIYGSPGLHVTYTDPAGTAHNIVIGFNGQYVIPTGVLTNGGTSPQYLTYTITSLFFGNPHTATITVYPQPNVAVNPTSYTICQGNSTTISVSGASSYTYIPSTGIIPGSPTTADPTVTTHYLVVGTDTGGCKDTAAFTVIVDSLPAFYVHASDSSMCRGHSTTLTAFPSTGYSYTWLPATGLSSTTGSSVIASPTTTTTYTVTATNSNGCIASHTITVVVTQWPISVSATSTSICWGQSTTLSASGATTYTWAPSSTLSSSTGTPVIATPVATTTYTVTGTDTTNGCIGSANITIDVSHPSIKLEDTHDTICSGYFSVITAYGNWSSVTWSPSSTLSSSSGSPVTASPTATSITNFTYTATATLNGCTVSAPITITVYPAPIITITPGTQTGCPNEVVHLTASSPDPYYSYAWTPAALVSPSTGYQVNAHVPSTTTFVVTGTDTVYGCKTQAHITLTIHTCKDMNSTGIETTQDEAEDYIVSPNPSTGTFTITQAKADDKPVMVEITDISGRTVYKQQQTFAGKTINMDLSRNPSGIYMLHIINSDTNSFVYKIVLTNQ